MLEKAPKMLYDKIVSYISCIAAISMYFIGNAELKVRMIKLLLRIFDKVEIAEEKGEIN